MSNPRIKRPRVALVSYAEEHHDRLHVLVNSLWSGEIWQVLASGSCVEPLRRMGVHVLDVSHIQRYANEALRGADRLRMYGPELPSIDMLCVTLSDISRYRDEFGSTNDTQDMELIKAEDMDRIALVLSACAGRRVVTARADWERGLELDIVEARTENEAWLAGRIREAMREVHKYIGDLAEFQKEFAVRMSVYPRPERPSKFAVA